MAKRKYVPPTIEVEYIELESCLAAGSNSVQPIKGNQFITDEYEQMEEFSDISW